MRTMLFVLCTLCLISGLAIAKPVLEKPVEPSKALVNLVEIEPNDTCQDASDNGNIITGGDVYDSAIDVEGDLDYYEVLITADGTFRFETAAGDAGDTKMYLYADDCVTELEFDDDGGDGLYSMFEVALVGNTTYYLLVNHYSATSTGTYILTMDEIIVVPPRPTTSVKAPSTCRSRAWPSSTWIWRAADSPMPRTWVPEAAPASPPLARKLSTRSP